MFISKEKGFNNKVKNIAYVVELLKDLILVNLLLYTKVSSYYIIKYIISSRVITNKRANILYNSIVFKN